ncbi:uncharacterized protein LOC102357047 [Latimeria chalumnae]|uniref:uncharacterized protein LOC102357047 n=1 Tax=Latimeria chalumnae TaxID=7897 RepID=UPI0003C168B6|nr:PREDICTED: uncharacterized protein LOC102357047 [Latimeria chalumnae]|eukprot:XP_005988323.1 PREDICTED: uncharacterized protein LOC102357047 [Latimeria chalumnae]
MQLACVLAMLLFIWEQDSSGNAEPVRVPAGGRVDSEWCSQHQDLHNRLDTVEKKIEETVDRLQLEVQVILDAIQAQEKSASISPGGPIIDILDDSNPVLKDSS